MKQIDKFIQEKLIINKNTDIHDYTEILGPGELAQFKNVNIDRFLKGGPDYDDIRKHIDENFKDDDYVWCVWGQPSIPDHKIPDDILEQFESTNNIIYHKNVFRDDKRFYINKLDNPECIGLMIKEMRSSAVSKVIGPVKAIHIYFKIL